MGQLLRGRPKKPEISRKNGRKSILVWSQGSSSCASVQQEIISCTNRIKMVQKPRKIKVFRGFTVSKRADMVWPNLNNWIWIWYSTHYKMNGCFFHFRNSGDRKSRHFTFCFGVAAFSISRSNSNNQKWGEVNEHANHRHRQPEGRRWLWKVSYYEKLSPYFIRLLVVWTRFTLHNSVKLLQWFQPVEKIFILFPCW